MMMTNPFRDVVVAGVYNTRQARRLDEETSRSVTFQAIDGVLADAGLTLADIDGINITSGVAYPVAAPDYRWDPFPLFGGRSVWSGWGPPGIAGVLEAAAAIVTGQCHTVLIANGQAGQYTDRAATAPWTRSPSEFIECWGLFTAAEFALLARKHMDLYGTTPEQLAEVASTVRTNGNRMPGAVYQGRGDVSPQDVLDSRMVADPFHLLDCCTTSEGGVGLILTTRERGRDLRSPAAYILGGAADYMGPAYERPPLFDELAWVGEQAGQRAFAMSGLKPSDVDVCEFYDNFSWEIIHQFELYGFCPRGEGGPFVMDGRIRPGGQFPVVTDGGTMSFSHIGHGQLLQRVVAAVQQVRGAAGPCQVPGAEVAIASNQGLTRRPVLLVGSEAA
jgi:acetyl-CoA acetyltransferase